MILLIECVAACLIFAAGIVGSVLYKKEMWIQDYAPAVQKKFIESNPDYVPKTKPEKRKALIVGKCAVALVFALILSGLVYLAGARSFRSGAIYSYIIWFVVNVFDVVVLDMIIFVYWKKIRLPGTEDMDKEYASNSWKHIKDGFYGLLIGLPVACICGLIVMVLK